MTIREAFLAQGKVCETLGSPFMGRLMPLIGKRLSEGRVAEKVLGWQGDPTASGDSVPLRLAGALHALKIEGLALCDVYPPAEANDDALWSALVNAMFDHEARLLDWLQSPPQTNEVRRAAPLTAALSVVSERYDAPIELIELGCSAGLNLRLDKFRVQIGKRILGHAGSSVLLRPEWTGNSPDHETLPIVERHGIDLNPIDPLTCEGRLRLLAYLWPDQPDRRTLTEGAIKVAQEAPATISQGDAGAWLEELLSKPAPDRTRVVFHTIAWQYFPDDTKRRALDALEGHTGPLVRISMEADGGHGASLTLTHYPAKEIVNLGRVDFHGRWVEWAA